MKKKQPNPIEKDIVFEKEQKEHIERLNKIGKYLNIENPEIIWLPHLISSYMDKLIDEIETLKANKQ